MLTIQSLCVNTRLLPLSIEAQRGDVIHILGPNGSGKSTFLSAVAGVIDFEGDVWLDEEHLNALSIEALAGRRAYLTQSGKPPFDIGVAQYLSLSMPAGVNAQDKHVAEIVAELCSLLELDDKLHRSIAQLSGGEWQRVRLAGICLQVWPSLNPYAKMLLLDEPAAPLDIGQESLLYQLIQRMADMGLVILMANHDLNRSLRYADKVVLIREGVMLEFGETKTVMTSEKLSTLFATDVQRVEFNGKNVLVFD
ncbi:vitamin B12 ABC transporter ATP-binding protein BtuD [Vibrio olivae]|uniref:Vitamin B12 import ATP-binding protein BtuD n=1 Tax=Vibrio olivae TaxID=1243002 RepID=A0ABV5HJ96_9VIBR